MMHSTCRSLAELPAIRPHGRGTISTSARAPAATPPLRLSTRRIPMADNCATPPTPRHKPAAMAQSHATIAANHANHDATHHQNPGGTHQVAEDQTPHKG